MRSKKKPVECFLVLANSSEMFSYARVQTGAASECVCVSVCRRGFAALLTEILSARRGRARGAACSGAIVRMQRAEGREGEGGGSYSIITWECLHSGTLNGESPSLSRLALFFALN